MARAARPAAAPADPFTDAIPRAVDMQERYKVQHGPPRTLCPVATSPSKLL